MVSTCNWIPVVENSWTHRKLSFYLTYLPQTYDVQQLLKVPTLGMALQALERLETEFASGVILNIHINFLLNINCVNFQFERCICAVTANQIYLKVIK